MEPKEQLAEVMKNTSLIALASSVEDLPNVRILDIFFDEKQNVVVFPTSAFSPKVKEFEANDTVAFTTIPQGPGPVVRVQNATVSKSDWAIDEIKDTLIAHRPGFEMMLKASAKMLWSMRFPLQKRSSLKRVRRPSSSCKPQTCAFTIKLKERLAVKRVSLLFKIVALYTI